MIEITDTALQTAAAEGIDAFLRAFTDKYREALGGDPTAETISRLNGEQHSLLAYRIFRDEVTEGGFCQLIQNGYGVYIFGNPFARVMRLWGAERFSKLVYAAKKIYDAHREDLERERTDEEFMAMYEQYEAFDELEEEFGEMEEEVTETLARYVDGHPGTVRHNSRIDTPVGTAAMPRALHRHIATSPLRRKRKAAGTFEALLSDPFADIHPLRTPGIAFQLLDGEFDGAVAAPACRKDGSESP